MAIVTVDAGLCIHDGCCIPACPRDLLIFDENKVPYLPQEKEQRCTRCGHCAAVCPVFAIRVDVAKGEDITPIRKEYAVGPAQADQLLQSCRSVRRFTGKAVPQEDIAAILQTARLAPSGGNNQMVRWAVLRDRQAVAKAADYIAEWFDTVARHNPKHAARYAIDNILQRYRAGKDVLLRGAPNAVLAYTSDKAAWGPVDSAIALTYFNLAAHARGVGSCWGGYLIRAACEHPPLREYLGIPEGCTVQGAMVFGYPSIRYRSIPVRNPLQVSWV